MNAAGLTLPPAAGCMLGVTGAITTQRAFLAAYRRVRYCFGAIRPVMDPSPLPKNRRLSQADLTARTRPMTPGQAEAARGRLEAFPNALLEAGISVLTGDERAAFDGCTGLDATPVPLYSRGPSRRTGLCASDPDGGWYGRAKVLKPPPEPPKICTPAITIAPDTGARYRQDLSYGSPAWHARYATLRNTIEGLNGYAKDPAHQALAQPARRQVRGIAAQSVFTALLLMAANIRKIRAWRALTARDKDRITQRVRRRRASLRDYLPDG